MALHRSYLESCTSKCSTIAIHDPTVARLIAVAEIWSMNSVTTLFIVCQEGTRVSASAGAPMGAPCDYPKADVMSASQRVALQIHV